MCLMYSPTGELTHSRVAKKLFKYLRGQSEYTWISKHTAYYRLARCTRIHNLSFVLVTFLL